MPPRKKSVISSEICDATTQTESNERNILNAYLQCTSSLESEGNSNESCEPQLVKDRMLANTVRLLSNAKNKAVNEHKQSEKVLQQIQQNIRMIKGDHETTFNRNREDIGALVSRFNQLTIDTNQLLAKQKDMLDDEKRKLRNIQILLKQQIDNFQAKLNIANDEKTLMASEIEELKQKVLLAEQDVINAKELEEEHKKKLDDKLFLASNQKCMSCLSSEKVKSMLTSEVAEKDRQLGKAKADYAQLHDQVESQKRVNQILSKDAEKARCNSKTWENEYKKLLKEFESYKATKGVLELPSTIVTPPDSDKSKDNTPEMPVDLPSPMIQNTFVSNKKKNKQNHGKSNHNKNKSQLNQPVVNLNDHTKRPGVETKKTSPIKRIKLNKNAVQTNKSVNASTIFVSSAASKNIFIQTDSTMDIQQAQSSKKFLRQDLIQRPFPPPPTIKPPQQFMNSNSNNQKTRLQHIPPPPSRVSGTNLRAPPPIDRLKIPPPPNPPSMSQIGQSSFTRVPPPPHTLVRPSKHLPWHGNNNNNNATEEHSWMFN